MWCLCLHDRFFFGWCVGDLGLRVDILKLLSSLVKPCVCLSVYMRVEQSLCLISRSLPSPFQYILAFHSLFLTIWLADGDFLMCCMIARLIDKTSLHFLCKDVYFSCYNVPLPYTRKLTMFNMHESWFPGSLHLSHTAKDLSLLLHGISPIHSTASWDPTMERPILHEADYPAVGILNQMGHIQWYCDDMSPLFTVVTCP